MNEILEANFQPFESAPKKSPQCLVVWLLFCEQTIALLLSETDESHLFPTRKTATSLVMDQHFEFCLLPGIEKLFDLLLFQRDFQIGPPFNLSDYLSDAEHAFDANIFCDLLTTYSSTANHRFSRWRVSAWYV